MALAMPSRNSASRPGRQASPRSPASQLPGGVEQHLLQAVGLQALGQLLRRVGVRKRYSTALKPSRSGGKAVEKVHVVVEHGQVGGKTGHGCLSV